MTRNKMIKKLIGMANELVSDYSGDKYREFISEACAWNSAHSGKEEIFVSDIYKEDGYENDGIAIEDDYFLYQ